MTIYFISDLHLSDQNNLLTQLWRQFISDYLKPGDLLYILGDFFDVWIGDDAMTTYQASILQDLKALTSTGVKVNLMVGNRDFMIGSQFAQSSGLTLLEDPSILTWPSMRVVLKHGDDLCTQDIRHQRFRRWSRSSLIKGLFLSLPVTIRQRIARWIKQQSRGRRGYSVLLDADRALVKSTLDQHQADVMIHGHTHRPGIDLFFEENRCQTRYVLADWQEQGNFICWSPLNGLEMRYFNIKT